MALQVYSSPITAEQEELLPGLNQVAEWSIWFLVESWEFTEADIALLDTAFDKLRGIVWHASGIALGKFRGRVKDFGNAFGKYPTLADHLVAQTITSYKLDPNKIYSGVANLDQDTYVDVAQLLSESTSGKDSAISFIPNNDTASREWVSVTYGLSWLWHCYGWLIYESITNRQKYNTLINYISLTNKIGGVAGIRIENLDALENGTLRQGIVFFGQKSILEPAAMRLLSNGERIRDEDFARWVGEGLHLK